MIRIFLTVLLCSLCSIAEAQKIRIESAAYAVEFAADAIPTTINIPFTVKYIPANPPPPPPPPPPVNSISIVDFGAKPNDSVDDTAAINNAARDAKAKGKSLLVPVGVFNHSGLIYVDSITMEGLGDGSELVATSTTKSSIYLRGKNPILKNLKHRFNTTGVQRQAHGDACSVFAEKCQGFTVENVTVVGSPSAGIMNWGAIGTVTNPCLIKNCRVSGTLADGIHNTASANFARVEGCTVTNTGDDGIAVVSYQSNVTPTKNITIINNDVSVVTWGRGISVVGGEFIEILDNKISRTCAAGLYFYAEGGPPWRTLAIKGVTARGNTIDKACVDKNGNPVCVTGHPGILIAGYPGYLASDITIDRNIVRTPTTDGIRVEPHVAKIVLSGNTITGVPANRKLITVNPAAAANVEIRP